MKMSKENYEEFRRLLTEFAEKCSDDQHVNTMIRFTKNQDIKNPVIAYIWQVFFSARQMGGALISDKFRNLKDGLNDSHLETALLKWYNESKYSKLLKEHTK